MLFDLKYRQVLNGIPSASGIAKVDFSFYVIGDNSALLFQLNKNFEIISKKPLLQHATDSILSKFAKPDFEAMTSLEIENKKVLLIFGSGSKSPQRDILIKVHFRERIYTTTYDLRVLYDSLRTSTQLNSDSLNIEAVATLGNSLYLFNREDNLVIEYQLDEFLNFIDSKNSLPNYKIFKINLPRLNGLSAKLSGACEIPNSKLLIVTASVEDAPNTYEDGDVKGSFIAILNIEDLKEDYEPPCVLISKNLEPLKIKVESVEVTKILSDTKLEIVLVTDSDGGDSELLVGHLTW